MTEIKNNSVDLLNLQYSSSAKKDTESLDDVSGFKTMLQSENQKQEDVNSGKVDEKDDNEAAVEAVAAMIAPESSIAEPVMPEEACDELIGQELVIDALAPEQENPIQTSGEPDIGMKQMENPYHALDQLRFKQLLGKQQGTEALPEEQIPEALSADGDEPVSTLQEEAPPQPELLPQSDEVIQTERPVLEEQTVQMASVETPVKNQPDERKTENGTLERKNPEQPVVEQPDAAQPVVEQETVVKADQAQAPEEQVKEPVAAVNNRPKGPEVHEKQEKLPEESIAAFQNKSSEPAPVKHVQTGKEPAVYATVHAENQEKLEADLSEQILRQVRTGKRELEVQLEPHNLGKINIKVTYEENQISVSVLCTESKTLKLLSQSAADLGSILESNIERPVQIVVDKQENDYLNNQQQKEGGQQQREQQQEQSRDENSEDFLQKMRLGILGTESVDYSALNYG